MAIVTLIDLVLAFLVVEILALAWVSRRDRRWPRFSALLPNLGAGACLVLAVRSVADGRSAAVVGILLALAGACHALDLVGRLKR